MSRRYRRQSCNPFCNDGASLPRRNDFYSTRAAEFENDHCRPNEVKDLCQNDRSSAVDNLRSPAIPVPDDFHADKFSQSVRLSLVPTHCLARVATEPRRKQFANSPHRAEPVESRGTRKKADRRREERRRRLGLFERKRHPAARILSN